MKSYTGEHLPLQETKRPHSDSDVVILRENAVNDVSLESQQVSPPDQVEEFRSRYPAPSGSGLTPEHEIRIAIIEQWLTGCWSEHDAALWLMAFKLLKSPQNRNAYKMLCRAAIHEFGASVTLPEPSEGSAPSGWQVEVVGRYLTNGK